MTSSSKLIRMIVVASSLTLLTVYVVHSQSRGRDAAPETKEEFMMPSSKVLTSPVFTVREPGSGSSDAVPVFPAMPDAKSEPAAPSNTPPPQP